MMDIVAIILVPRYEKKNIYIDNNRACAVRKRTGARAAETKTLTGSYLGARDAESRQWRIYAGRARREDTWGRIASSVVGVVQWPVPTEIRTGRNGVTLRTLFTHPSDGSSTGESFFFETQSPTRSPRPVSSVASSTIFFLFFFLFILFTSFKLLHTFGLFRNRADRCFS